MKSPIDKLEVYMYISIQKAENTQPFSDQGLGIENTQLVGYINHIKSQTMGDHTHARARARVCKIKVYSDLE
jgi:hypothetical protein